MLQKTISEKSKKATNTIKLFMFKGIDQKDIVFALDMQDAKGEVYWQFKSSVNCIPGL
jgi:hypothetical protein